MTTDCANRCHSEVKHLEKKKKKAKYSGKNCEIKTLSQNATHASPSLFCPKPVTRVSSSALISGLSSLPVDRGTPTSLRVWVPRAVPKSDHYLLFLGG